MITEIELGGQIRTLAFNNYSKEALGRLYGIDPMEATQKMSSDWSESLLTLACDVIYCGLIGHCRLTRASVDFKIKDVSEWVASGDEREIAKALNAWGSTEEVRSLIQLGGKGEEAKKKSPGRKSKTSR